MVVTERRADQAYISGDLAKGSRKQAGNGKWVGITLKLLLSASVCKF